MHALYQEMLVDHGQNPRHFYSVDKAQYIQAGDNPLCGDNLVVYLYYEAGVVKKIGFQGEGCTICMASASLMCEALEGKTLSSFQALFDGFYRLVMGQTVEEDLGKLLIFSGVSQYPVRVKCATLPWHTLKAAIASHGAVPSVTTEE